MAAGRKGLGNDEALDLAKKLFGPDAYVLRSGSLFEVGQWVDGKQLIMAFGSSWEEAFSWIDTRKLQKEEQSRKSPSIFGGGSLDGILERANEKLKTLFGPDSPFSVEAIHALKLPQPTSKPRPLSDKTDDIMEQLAKFLKNSPTIDALMESCSTCDICGLRKGFNTPNFKCGHAPSICTDCMFETSGVPDRMTAMAQKAHEKRWPDCGGGDVKGVTSPLN